MNSDFIALVIMCAYKFEIRRACIQYPFGVFSSNEEQIVTKHNDRIHVAMDGVACWTNGQSIRWSLSMADLEKQYSIDTKEALRNRLLNGWVWSMAFICTQPEMTAADLGGRSCIGQTDVIIPYGTSTGHET